jgi:hypothetical protein
VSSGRQFAALRRLLRFLRAFRGLRVALIGGELAVRKELVGRDWLGAARREHDRGGNHQRQVRHGSLPGCGFTVAQPAATREAAA